MGKPVSLSCLTNGSFALITEVAVEGLTRRRLLDLGLVPGTKVEVIRRSPVGDPIAYGVRGAVIVLRKEVASKVFCEDLGR
ncbi:MAG: ferrous iron transport protein A [Firmicutes bacterium]|nr:ferrous iron transport protein A [Bacillota bacterium]